MRFEEEKYFKGKNFKLYPFFQNFSITIVLLKIKTIVQPIKLYFYLIKQQKNIKAKKKMIKLKKFIIYIFEYFFVIN